MLSTRCLKLAVESRAGMSLAYSMGSPPISRSPRAFCPYQPAGLGLFALARWCSGCGRRRRSRGWRMLFLDLQPEPAGGHGVARLALAGYDFVGLVPVVISALLGVWLGALFIRGELVLVDPGTRGNPRHEGIRTAVGNTLARELARNRTYRLMARGDL